MKILFVFDEFNGFINQFKSKSFECFYASFYPASPVANFVPQDYIKSAREGANFIEKIFREQEWDIVVFSSETLVKETASYFAGEHRLGLVTHAEELIFNENGLSVRASAWENYEVRIISHSLPLLVISRSEGIVPVNIKEKEIIYFTKDSSVTLLSREALGENPLKSAKIVVCIGRGVKRELIPQVLDFGSKIGAGIGCTRPVADSGTLPYEMVIGETGISISPDVYIGFGVSGAIQHLSCVNTKYIIAVNSDPLAPIFRKAILPINQKIEEVLSEMSSNLNDL